MKKEKKREVFANGSPAHYNAVIMEGIRSEMQVVVEGMQQTKVELQREIRDFREEVNGRFTIVEAAICKNSADIKELKTEMKSMQTEMKSMEVRLSDKIDASGNRLDEHEAKPMNIAHPTHP